MVVDEVQYSKLPTEVQALIEQAEKNKPENQQLEVLSDVALMLQEIINLLDSQQNDKTVENLGALLMDMRESLDTLKNRADPTLPDFSKPVVKAITSLDKSFNKAIKGLPKPDFNPNIKVDSPDVHVSPPDVDLRGVEKVLKNEVPKAFEKAIKLLPLSPELDLTPLQDDLDKLYKMMSDKLESIDNGTRLKPQFPNTLKVTNTDGSPINAGKLVTEEFDYIGVGYPDATTETYSYKSGGSSGQLVATVTVVYTDTTKANLSTVSRS
jgi:hypothetical protein